MCSASSAEHSGTAPAADMMDHQHVDADGTGQDGIGAPGRVCCKEPVVLIPQRRRQGCKQPDVDAKALKHDKTLVKTLLETLCTLALKTA